MLLVSCLDFLLVFLNTYNIFLTSAKFFNLVGDATFHGSGGEDLKNDQKAGAPQKNLGAANKEKDKLQDTLNKLNNISFN